MMARAACAGMLVVGLTTTVASAEPSQAGGTDVGPPHSVTTYDPSHGCDTDGPFAGLGWCNYYGGATTGHGGEPVELAATVCRLPGLAAHTLQADTGQQAEFFVGDRSAPSWIWARGHRFSPYGATFNVQPGSCLRWHVTWNVVDDAGRPLAPGAYDLIARSIVYPPGSVQAQAYLDNMYFVVT